MSEPKRPHAKTLIVAAAALVLMASFGFGRLVAKQDRPAAQRAVKQVELRVESADAPERYKVPISLSQPTRGAADALVSVVEWCDLRGEACRASDAILQSLLREYDGRVRHVFRHFPAQASQESLLAHEFARIAHEQGGKFWQARAALLANDESVTTERLQSIAARLDMDWAGFAKALSEHSHVGYVGADALFAGKFAVDEAPTYFVNGRKLQGAPSRARLKRLIDDELAHAGKLVAEGTPRENLYQEITAQGLWQAPSAHSAR